MNRIRIQRAIGFLFFIPFCGSLIVLMWLKKGYRIENIGALRRQFRRMMRDRSPLLICSNHLTYLDSPLIIWAMAWHFWYVFNFRCLSWNLPAVEYKKSFFFRLVGYLAKCLFIDREGGKTHHHEVLDRVAALLAAGEVVTIFPEGKRSRTGSFDPEHLTYGVGRIVTSLRRCRVLCIYIRGDKQDTYSNYPPPGSRFYIATKLIVPTFNGEGREAYREIVEQIGRTIKSLENEYFERRSSHEEKIRVHGGIPLHGGHVHWPVVSRSVDR